MIVDLRKHSSKNYRPFTALGAMDWFVDQIEPGQSALLERVIDWNGEDMEVPNIRAALNKIGAVCKKGRMVKTRAVDGGLLVVRLS